MSDMSDAFNYTVCDSDGQERRIKISYRVQNVSGYAVLDKVDGVAIGAQQLAEIGFLLFSLALDLEPHLDLMSAMEVIEGFDVSFPKKAMKEMIEAEETTE